MSISKKIFNEIIKDQDNPIVLFDLDSTLFNVISRTESIVQDFTNDKNYQSKYQNETLKLKEIKFTEKDWGLRDALIRLDIQANLAFFEDLRKYWREHFFSNHYLHKDRPYEGAPNYVKALYDNNIEVGYLTGRDAPNMKKGTLDSLDQHGFPLDDEKLLIMKSKKGIQLDENYKFEVLKKIRSNNRSIWFFENEPIILRRVEETLPDVKLIFLDTVHSGRAPSPTHLPTIKGKYER
jgi:hypothetical protein